MKGINHLTTLGVRLLVLIVVTAAGTLGQDVPKTGVIRGYVMDNERRPLPDVRLTLGSRGGLTSSSQTNASGQFGFTDLPFGSYVLTIAAPSYRVHTANVSRVLTTSSGQSLTVEISSAHPNADVAVSLRRTTTIIGSVLDSEGKPTLSGSVVLRQRRFNPIGLAQLVPVRLPSFVDGKESLRSTASTKANTSLERNVFLVVRDSF